MAGPRDLESLHKMKDAGRRSRLPGSPLEQALDTLLTSSPQGGKKPGGEAGASQEQSPLDALRDAFMDELIPAVAQINARYAEKGVRVTMDAADFLGGGRSVVIEIEFKDHRLRLEGTVMSDRIAFNEIHYVADLGGTVTGGPLLRRGQINAEGFGEFLFERIIALVKAASPASHRD